MQYVLLLFDFFHSASFWTSSLLDGSVLRVHFGGELFIFLPSFESFEKGVWHQSCAVTLSKLSLSVAWSFFSCDSVFWRTKCLEFC